MVDDLKMIKKHYGEDMMHLCRMFFATLLETPGLLYTLMESNFAPNHSLYDDIISHELEVEFKNYIYSLVDVSKNEIIVIKTPQELMDEAGYTLYECKSEEDIQEFRKYYANRESLCTFSGGRLNSCYVFFAVKKNVDEIKREDFLEPQRQDRYGTSVISIQFSRGDINTLSIKNRYNHRVSNPDATYSNNLENIIPGLTASFEKMYGLRINQNGNRGFELPGYVRGNDGKYYKYNYEINNKYYCPDNIIIDNFEVIRDYQEKEKYIIADYFVIDLVNKTIGFYYNSCRILDCFVDGIKNIEKIDVRKDKNTGNKVITMIPSEGSEIVIEIDKFNRIIGYKNNNLKHISNFFLTHNRVLSKLELSNVVEIGTNFLECNLSLRTLDLPNVEKTGSCFLSSNFILEEFSAPKLKHIDVCFMENNAELTVIDLPNVETISGDFITMNHTIEMVNMPKLIWILGTFLSENRNLKRLSLPNLLFASDNFLSCNNSLLELDLPKLKRVGKYFLHKNGSLETINLPNLYKIGDYFLPYNSNLKSINLPRVVEVGNDFLRWNSKSYELLKQINESNEKRRIKKYDQ